MEIWSNNFIRIIQCCQIWITKASHGILYACFTYINLFHVSLYLFLKTKLKLCKIDCIFYYVIRKKPDPFQITPRIIISPENQVLLSKYWNLRSRSLDQVSSNPYSFNNIISLLLDMSDTSEKRFWATGRRVGRLRVCLNFLTFSKFGTLISRSRLVFILMQFPHMMVIDVLKTF